MRALVLSLALILLPSVGRAAASAVEPCPTGWEPGSPQWSRILIVPPLVALPELEPMPSGWPPQESVAELAERSIRLFGEKKFSESVWALEIAYAIDPQPLFLFNIGQALRLSDDPLQAIAYYQRFVQLAPQHRLVPEAKGYIADLRVLRIEQERTVMARRLLELEQARAKQEAELLRFRALQAEEEKRVLTEQLRKSSRPVYKRAWFWGVLGGAAAVTAAAIGVGVYYAKTPQVDGGFVDIHF